MELTREEAIRIHRDMWRYLKEHGAEYNALERCDLKKQYCKEHGYSFYYDCVLCEYAEQNGGCDACPAIWGGEDKKKKAFCQWNYSVDMEAGWIDWRYSDIDDIINIKMKGEE